MRGWADGELRKSRLLAVFGETFLRELVECFVLSVYPETYDEAFRAGDPWARYELGHSRYVRAQRELNRLCLEHGIPVVIGLNRSRDGHSIAFVPPLIATIHKQRRSNVPPRRAAYRRLYAAASQVSQLHLFHDEESFGPPVMFDDSVPIEYVMFGHGPFRSHGRELAFLTASFAGKDGRFFGQPVDLLSLRNLPSAASKADGLPFEDVGDLGDIAPKIEPDEEENTQ